MVSSEKTAPKPPGRLAKTSGGPAAVKVNLNKKKQIPQHSHHHHQKQQQQQQHRKKFGNSSDRRNMKGNGLAKGNVKKTAPLDNEPYVVVITNVENDFAKVHQNALPRYCCLDESHCHSGNTVNTNADRRQCHYTVSVRTETRSVEVSVYGKADADVSTIFHPVGGTDVNHKIHHKDDNKKGINTAVCEVVESVRNHKGSSSSNNSTRNNAGSTLFATLEDMALALRHKPYFTHPPQFFINIPGKQDGEVVRQAKRRRGEGDSHENHNKVPKTNNVVEEDNENNETSTKMENTCDKTSNGVHHSTARQAEMVTAVASTSTRMTTKDIFHQMRDIPGFVNCWLLYPQHFRVVFATKTTLFKAKQLLDQFEVDAHVRVSLTLSDALGREFAEFVAAEEIVS